MQVTASELKVQAECTAILDTLLKSGYPQLLNTTLLQHQNPQELLCEYFQPSPRREHLIDWLIVQIYPLYQEEVERNQKKGIKKKRTLTYLWKLGVLPYSKHTKNLDYQKCLQGLLGLENSVNLIYNLTLLLQERRKQVKAKEDSQFSGFIEELMRRYDQLVNIEFQPYKSLNQEEFNEKYKEFEDKWKNIKDSNDKQGEDKSDFLFTHFETHKKEFTQKYTQLIARMNNLIQNNASLVKNWKKQEKSEGKERIIRISQRLPKLYREYKEKIKPRRLEGCSIGITRAQVEELITNLNDQVVIPP